MTATAINPNIDNVVRKLIKVLLEEITAYNHLLESLNNKQQAIMSGEIELINNAVEDEQRILHITKQIDMQRKYALNDVQIEMDQDSDFQTLDQLIELVEYRYRDRLMEIKESLQNIIKKVTVLNDQNKVLLEHSIDFVKGMVKEFLHFAEESKSTYTPTGKNNEVDFRNLLDRRI